MGLVAEGRGEVLGCGGFIKADKSLDFSKINVQLWTKQGSLKEETDCAPHNGYFFVPLYEKGDYVLKVSPPLGWKFTPDEVAITVDGETDACSQNRDINFEFAGFGVVGRVLASGLDKGPAGVDIELLSGDGRDVVQKTVTVKDGNYVFTAVAGADHKVRAQHPTWQFTKDTGTVKMTGHNGAAEDLLLAGFDVSGSVVAGSEPISGVSIVLFGKSGAPLEHCTDNTASSAKGPAGTKQLCRTVTDNKGSFVFPVVPSGDYSLVPFYKGDLTHFEVSPSNLDISVGLDSVKIAKPFTVEGFSVRGQVLAGEQGLEGAKVQLTGGAGKEVTVVTGKKGEYYIEKIESGTYTISVQAEGIEFKTVKAEISPRSPVVPAVKAGRFLVSGVLDFSTVSPDSNRKVLIASTGRSDLKLDVGEDGKFSTLLPPAPYTISVLSSQTDSQMGIVFAPLSLDVLVKSGPVSGLYFSPVRVTIAGVVNCIDGACPDGLKVELKGESGQSDEGVDQEVGPDGRFSFQNQLPGRYRLSVDEGKLCWDQPSVVFNLESESKEDLKLSQTGWMMEVHASHPTTLNYHTSDNKHKGTLSIAVGGSTHCMPAKSEFILETSSCHQFQGDAKLRWSPGSKVSLRADKHLISGRVNTVETIPDLQMQVHTSTEVKTLALTQPEAKDGLNLYRFSYMSNPHEEVTMEPIASKFLFNPTKLHISMEDDCQLDLVLFTATKGLFISGAVKPALEGVAITLESSSLPEPATIVTDVSGKYTLGPFPRDLQYTVKAERLGYVITESKTKGEFTAEKLASIILHITNSEGERLSEVVVSLSGGEKNFRTNQQTGSNGTLSFIGLSPGEYFIKPMLKEYEFTPKSKLMTVQEGREEIVEIVATRVAHSLYGTLSGLKGDAEAGVTIEVVGEEDPCTSHQEEGTTGQDGKFRIRGLTPNCQYRLGLKHAKSNNHVERILPAIKTIKAAGADVTGIELIALRPRTNMDVSLLVKLSKDSIKNVKARLFCGFSSDSPLHTVKLDTVKFVIFPSIPSDGKQCWITVEGNSIHLNQRVKPERVEFVADKPFDHFTLELDVESSLARGEFGQASWMTLPLLIILVTAVLHWQKVSPYLAGLADQIERAVMKGRGNGRRARSPGPDADNMSAEDIDKAVKFVEASTRKRIKPKKI